MESARVMVDSVQAAAEVLYTVLEHARGTRSNYEFGPVDAPAVLRVGMTLSGEIEEVLEDILDVSGVILVS